MKLRILAVPYDSARPDWRMGRGPTHLLEGGLVEALRQRGHEVEVERIGVNDSAPPLEVGTAFALARTLAQRVRQAVSQGEFPLVLAGNCNSAIGTVAGLGPADTEVVWFDAHADFNTPETTVSGFFDGMALAVVAGRCWRSLAATVPGFRPVPERNVLLIGARDLDPPEEEMLARSEVIRVASGDLNGAGVRESLRRAARAYIHLDLDVLDPSEARVNCFAAPGGLTVAAVAGAIQEIGVDCRIAGAALTAYDPSSDETGTARQAAVRLIEGILNVAGGGP